MLAVCGPALATAVAAVAAAAASASAAARLAPFWVSLFRLAVRVGSGGRSGVRGGLTAGATGLDLHAHGPRSTGDGNTTGFDQTRRGCMLLVSQVEVCVERIETTYSVVPHDLKQSTNGS